MIEIEQCWNFRNYMKVRNSSLHLKEMWKDIKIPCTQQQDGYSCGVFTLMANNVTWMIFYLLILFFRMQRPSFLDSHHPSCNKIMLQITERLFFNSWPQKGRAMNDEASWCVTFPSVPCQRSNGFSVISAHAGVICCVPMLTQNQKHSFVYCVSKFNHSFFVHSYHIRLTPHSWVSICKNNLSES